MVYRLTVINTMQAAGIFVIGLAASLIMLVLSSYYRNEGKMETYHSLRKWGIGMSIATVVITIAVAACSPKVHHASAEDTMLSAQVDTTSLKYHVIRTCDEEIARQQEHERCYNRQRPNSCYADAIDYTDLYAIKELAESTPAENTDSIIKLFDMLYETVRVLDNEYVDLFTREGVDYTK